MDFYTTTALRGILAATIAPKLFLLETFFGNVIDAQEEEIAFDVIDGKRRISPFVSPLVPGQIVESPTGKVNRFKPAYVKDKRPIDPRRPLKRRAGESIGGTPNLTPSQREAAILADEIQDMNDMYHRRLEVMAADALDDGVVVVDGPGFPAVQVDYGRAAGQTVQLAGGARWGEAGVSPVATIQAHRRLVLKSGFAVTDVVMTPDSFDLFAADPLFDKLLNTNYRGGESEMELLANVAEGGELQGRLGKAGPNIWIYSQQYIDPADGVEKDILPAHTVLMGSRDPKAQGARAFGAILDPDAEYGVARDNLFVKSWTEKDPGQRLIMGQGAPLTVLTRPNTTSRIRVR